MRQVIAVMILIIAIGYVVDGLVFRTIERRFQDKWGLTPAT
jgi:ABC-type nitrate/sulfonate/bicarbonate transport system permease component